MTVDNIGAACGGICTVVNSVHTMWASSIRVHSLSVWNPGSTTVQNSAQVVWFGVGTLQAKDEGKIASIPTGITVTAPVNSKPPRQSLAWDWQTTVSNTNTLFQLIVDAGCVIDMAVSFTLGNNLGIHATTIATGVLGTIYYLALDGPSSNKLVAQGVPTTS